MRRDIIEGATAVSKYVVTLAIVDQIVLDAHLLLSHLSAQKVSHYLRQVVWFPSMWAAISRVLQECAGCRQKVKIQADRRLAGCHFPRPKGTVASQIHLDLAGPLSIDMDSFRYILGVQDNMSGYCANIPIRGKCHKEDVEKLSNCWLHVYGKL